MNPPEFSKVITPKIPPRPKLPDVRIMLCCAGDDYLCARVNGKWHEFFFEEEELPGKPRVTHCTSHPATHLNSEVKLACRLCDKALPSEADGVDGIKKYRWGQSAALDDQFTILAEKGKADAPKADLPVNLPEGQKEGDP